ncbi:MAG: hypothetical protein ACLP7J_24655, partial [Streptosporangiaceae bacterium]
MIKTTTAARPITILIITHPSRHDLKMAPARHARPPTRASPGPASTLENLWLIASKAILSIRWATC